VSTAPVFEPGALVACHHSISGAGVPDPARHGFVERLTAAARAGLTGIGLTWVDYQHLRETSDPAELRKAVDDSGVAVIEIEFLNAWWADGDRGRASREQATTLYEMADVFDARHLNVGASVAAENAPPFEAMVDRFAGVCDRAAEHGLLVGLEPMPFFVLSDVSRAWDVVRAADRGNAGLVIDAYHWFRGTPQPDAVRDIPAERFFAIQLCDGPRQAPRPLLEETLDARLWPGEGEWDLAGLVRLLSDHGVTAPVEVEVLNAEARTWSVDDLARRAGESVRGVIAAAALPATISAG
jgi:sugar phosphate isomerase/epimerase